MKPIKYYIKYFSVNVKAHVPSKCMLERLSILLGGVPDIVLRHFRIGIR